MWRSIYVSVYLIPFLSSILSILTFSYVLSFCRYNIEKLQKQKEKIRLKNEAYIVAEPTLPDCEWDRTIALADEDFFLGSSDEQSGTSVDPGAEVSFVIAGS